MNAIFRAFGGHGVRLRTLQLLVAISLLIDCSMAPRQANAQSGSDQLALSAPVIFQLEMSTEVPLEIRVAPESAAPAEARVLVRGLPASISLSNGRQFDSGVWALRIDDLPGLKIAVPASLGGDTQPALTYSIELSIAVVTPERSVLAETKSMLVIVPSKAPATIPEHSVEMSAAVADGESKPAKATALEADDSPTTEAAPRSEQGEQAPQQVRKSFSSEEMQRIEMFMASGAENLQAGQINVARLFYRRACEMGWAPGAIALAKTYDPAELEGTIGGVQPDAKLAKQWYQKALELGSPEAQRRLTRLESR